jgi:hypothetical protein
MAQHSTRRPDRVTRLLEAGDPTRQPISKPTGSALPRRSRCFDPQPATPGAEAAPPSRPPRLAAPRGFLLVGAILALIAGGAAAATELLRANTGQYAKGPVIKEGGPGEYLREAAPEVCHVALRLSSGIAYPPGGAGARLHDSFLQAAPSVAERPPGCQVILQ